MNKIHPKLPAALSWSLVSVLILLSGCSRSTYVAFADSGTAFNKAMLQASASGRRLTVTKQSELLLSQMPGRSASQRAANLTAAEKVNEDSIATLKKLDGVSSKMLDYFDALRSLASSDAPEEIGKQVEAAGTNLTNFVKATGGTGSNIGSVAPVLTSAAGGLAGLAVDAALKRELESRHEVLELAFDLQEEALGQLVDDVEDAADVIADKRYDRLIRQPYVAGRVSGGSAQNAWIDEQVDLSLMSHKVAAIGESKKQMKQMRKNYEALREGKISAADLDRFTTQIIGFMTQLQAI